MIRLASSEWTTLSIRRETRRMLEEARKKIREETGLTLSLEDTVAYLINYYIKHVNEQGKVEAPAVIAGA